MRQILEQSYRLNAAAWTRKTGRPPQAPSGVSLRRAAVPNGVPRRGRRCACLGRHLYGTQQENEDKFSQIDCLIDNKRHSGFGFGNEATVCCKTDGRIGNGASKLASSKVAASYRTPNQVLTMAKGTARGDPAASLAGLAARPRQNGAAEGALAQREAVCIRKQVNTLDFSSPALSGLALNLRSQLAEINNGQRIICSSDRLGSSLASPRLSCEQSGQSVQICTEFEPSQPAPFSLGKTVVVPQTNVQTKESAAHRVELH